MSETTPLIRNARLDQLAVRLQTEKGNVLAIAQLPEPHLALACVEIRLGEYVTWKVNLQVCLDFPDCGCGHGQYFTVASVNGAEKNRTDAMYNFMERYAEAWGAEYIYVEAHRPAGSPPQTNKALAEAARETQALNADEV